MENTPTNTIDFISFPLGTVVRLRVFKTYVMIIGCRKAYVTEPFDYQGVFWPEGVLCGTLLFQFRDIAEIIALGQTGERQQAELFQQIEAAGIQSAAAEERSSEGFVLEKCSDGGQRHLLPLGSVVSSEDGDRWLITGHGMENPGSSNLLAYCVKQQAPDMRVSDAGAFPNVKAVGYTDEMQEQYLRRVERIRADKNKWLVQETKRGLRLNGGTNRVSAMESQNSGELSLPPGTILCLREIESKLMIIDSIRENDGWKYAAVLYPEGSRYGIIYFQNEDIGTIYVMGYVEQAEEAQRIKSAVVEKGILFLDQPGSVDVKQVAPFLPMGSIVRIPSGDTKCWIVMGHGVPVGDELELQAYYVCEYGTEGILKTKGSVGLDDLDDAEVLHVGFLDEEQALHIKRCAALIRDSAVWVRRAKKRGVYKDALDFPDTRQGLALTVGWIALGLLGSVIDD